MVSGDPQRTPTFTAFADPDYFVFGGAATLLVACVAVQPGFAWNHGDFSPDINETWLGMVGPGWPTSASPTTSGRTTPTSARR